MEATLTPPFPIDLVLVFEGKIGRPWVRCKINDYNGMVEDCEMCWSPSWGSTPPPEEAWQFRSLG